MAKIKSPWFNFVSSEDARVSRLSYLSVSNSTIFVLSKIGTLKFLSQVSCRLFNQKEMAFCFDYFKGPWTDDTYINCVITYTVKVRFYFLRWLGHQSHPLHTCLLSIVSPPVRNSKRKKQPGSTKKSKSKEPRKSPTKGMTASFSRRGMDKPDNCIELSLHFWILQYRRSGWPIRGLCL